MNELAKIITPLKSFFQFYLLTLLVLSFSRLCLVLWQLERVVTLDNFFYILMNGFRFDVITTSFLILLPATLTLLFSVNHRASLLLAVFNRYYLSVAFGLVIFIEASTPDFINQFGLRPNIWFVEYLKYPQEVVSMLLNGYLLSFIAGTSLALTGAIVLFKKLEFKKIELPRETRTSKLCSATISALVLFMLLSLSIRSSIGLRPVSPSTVAFSQDQLLNSLPLNSFYSAGYAASKLIKESHKSTVYTKGDLNKMINDTHEFIAVGKADFTSDKLFTLHHSYSVEKNTASKPMTKKKNLVIILEESLGAEYVQRLGGLPVTPNLEALAKQGWWFENMFATGTRSARGIEAVITGFLPTIAQSTIKRSKSQDNFFTIASLLKSQGYDTEFIYGGDSSFDNMRGFFLSNGFDTIFDQHDFVDPIFNASWGVSDEDLFNKAHQQFESKDKTRPFFSLLFTTSNHPPYVYPEGRIEPYKGITNSGASAVKYTDYALGEFFKKAKASNYWQDTLFLIVADHASRVVSNDLIPIERFHIPALILGGNITAKQTRRIVSQIDLMPTMLSLLELSVTHPMPGLDLTRDDLNAIPQKILMQYAHVQAYREDNRVIIFQPEMKPEQFDFIANKLNPVEHIDKALLSRAISISNLPTYLYENRLYQSIN